MNSLVQTICTFRKDIGIELGMEKCSVLVIVGIELPDSKVIKSLQEGGGYKYIGSLEAERFLEEEMKLKVPKEYFRRLKKKLKSKLNGGI